MLAPGTPKDPIQVIDVRDLAVWMMTLVQSRTTGYFNAVSPPGAFTMGDIVLGCGIWRWMALPIERPPMPNMQRWYDALTKRPAYRKTVMLPLT